MAKKQATKKTKAIVKKEASRELQTIDGTAGSLIKLAIDKGNGMVDIPTLEALIKMKNQEEEREAKKLFEGRFSAMQRVFPTVGKSKDVCSKTGKKLYSYSPLDDILKVFAPILAEYGFSYRWNERTINQSLEKEITCYIAGYGHTIESSVTIPYMPGNDFTNSIQQRGSSTTYGKRYSFCSVLGIIISGDDTDANKVDSDVSKQAQKKIVENKLDMARKKMNVLYKEIGASELFTTEEIKSIENAAINFRDSITDLDKLRDDWQAAYNERRR